MGIITPPPGAIPNYLWVQAQQGMKAILKAVSADQELFNSDYKFRVETNLYRPTIEEIENVALVNILIREVTSDEHETNFAKNHVVKYNFDCYVRGQNEDDPDNPGSLVPADEVAVERLQYLCAQVEYGLTELVNFYQGVLPGDIYPDKLDLTFNPVEDAAESATPYAPARFEFICKFPYSPKDLENLPALTEVLTNLADWAVKVFPKN